MRFRPASVMIVVACAWCAGGCVSTTLLYQPNVYQLAPTAGRGHWRVGGDVAAVPAISTTADSSGVSQDWGQDGFSLGLWGQYGVSERVDVGLYVNAGSFDDKGSLGVRGFAKWCVAPSSDRVAVALMPAAFFIQGSRTESGIAPSQKIESRAYGAELHLPMNYSLSPHTGVTWTPHFVYLWYEAPFEYHAVIPAFDRSVTGKGHLAGLGMSIGFRYRMLHPELVQLITNHGVFYGIGLAIQP